MDTGRPTSPGVGLFGKPVIKRAVNLQSLSSFVTSDSDKESSTSPRGATAAYKQSSVSPRGATAAYKESSISPRYRTEASHSPRAKPQAYKESSLSPRYRSEISRESSLSPRVKTETIHPLYKTETYTASSLSPRYRSEITKESSLSPRIRTTETEKSPFNAGYAGESQPDGKRQREEVIVQVESVPQATCAAFIPKGPEVVPVKDKQCSTASLFISDTTTTEKSELVCPPLRLDALRPDVVADLPEQLLVLNRDPRLSAGIQTASISPSPVIRHDVRPQSYVAGATDTKAPKATQRKTSDDLDDETETLTIKPSRSWEEIFTESIIHSSFDVHQEGERKQDGTVVVRVGRMPTDSDLSRAGDVVKADGAAVKVKEPTSATDTAAVAEGPIIEDIFHDAVTNQPESVLQVEAVTVPTETTKGTSDDTPRSTIAAAAAVVDEGAVSVHTESTTSTSDEVPKPTVGTAAVVSDGAVNILTQAPRSESDDVPKPAIAAAAVKEVPVTLSTPAPISTNNDFPRSTGAAAVVREAVPVASGTPRSAIDDVSKPAVAAAVVKEGPVTIPVQVPQSTNNDAQKQNVVTAAVTAPVQASRSTSDNVSNQNIVASEVKEAAGAGPVQASRSTSDNVPKPPVPAAVVIDASSEAAAAAVRTAPGTAVRTASAAAVRTASGTAVRTASSTAVRTAPATAVRIPQGAAVKQDVQQDVQQDANRSIRKLTKTAAFDVPSEAPRTKTDSVPKQDVVTHVVTPPRRQGAGLPASPASPASPPPPTVASNPILTQPRHGVSKKQDVATRAAAAKSPIEPTKKKEDLPKDAGLKRTVPSKLPDKPFQPDKDVAPEPPSSPTTRLKNEPPGSPKSPTSRIRRLGIAQVKGPTSPKALQRQPASVPSLQDPPRGGGRQPACAPHLQDPPRGRGRSAGPSASAKSGKVGSLMRSKSSPAPHVCDAPSDDGDGESDSDSDDDLPLLRVGKKDTKGALKALKAIPIHDSPELRRKERPRSADMTEVLGGVRDRSVIKKDRPQSEVIYEGMVAASKANASSSKRAFSVFEKNFKSDVDTKITTLPRQNKPKPEPAVGGRGKRPVSWAGQEIGIKAADGKSSMSPDVAGSVCSIRDRFNQSSDSMSSSSLSSSRESSVSSLRDRFMSSSSLDDPHTKSRTRVQVVSPPPGGRRPSGNMSNIRDRFASPTPESDDMGRDRVRSPDPVKIAKLRNRFASPPPPVDSDESPKARVRSPDPVKVAKIRNRFASPPPVEEDTSRNRLRSPDPVKMEKIRNRFASPPPTEADSGFKPTTSRTAKLKDRLFSPPPESSPPSSGPKLRDRIFPFKRDKEKKAAKDVAPVSAAALPDVVSEEKPPDVVLRFYTKSPERVICNVEEDEFNEGLILPPLIIQLRKILDQYPDDSQILKELIQNAEDAGAKTIRFLYDRHAYGTNPRFLQHPGLAKFQGPALYAQNDALFNEDDWKGIRMLSQSVKQNDPFKVGYFGLGFKSIFHITDMPSVLSGPRLGMIDPHQRCFPAATHSWNLAKKTDLVATLPDQMAPFLRVFDCSKDVFQEGFYNGTIFRFPLRTRPSPLSDSLYDKDKVHRLFRSFQADAHLLLKFLKHLETIELYERDELSVKPRLVFKVQLAEECLEDVRQKRSAFLNKAKSGQWLEKPIKSTFPITVETVRMEGSKEHTKTYRWLVTNYYSGGQVSAIFRKLHRDAELSYPPWVGIAMPITLPAENPNNTQDIYTLDDSDGHVFCFLPLPSEKQTPTGLPVHINGFFALEQNRKYLKWPNAAQRQEDLMDKRLLWNQCLLQEAIPKAYCELLLQAIDMHSTGTNHNISLQTIYRAFPDFSKVDRKWEIILVPVFSELLKHPVVHTAARGGEYCHPKDAIFNTLEVDAESRQVILKVLAQNDVRVAEVPDHVLHAIKQCCHINLAKITPNLVSSSYKLIQNKCGIETTEKLLLLRYLISSRKYELIDGLLLLPLSNGGFHYFYTNPRRADRTIFIPTVDHPQALLPGLDDNFLESDIEEDILMSLAKASSKGYTQLKLLTRDLVIELLPQCLPSEWQSGSPVTWTPGEPQQPPVGWLELLWVYLQKHCRRDLSMFEGLSIMPVLTTEGSTELVPLYAISGIIVQHLDGMSLGEKLEGILIRLGVVVLPVLPDYVRSHPMVLEHYVYSPSYVGVLRTLHRITEHVGFNKFLNVFNEVTDDDDKRHLRELFSRMSPFHLKPEHKPLLCKLPLFETLTGSGAQPSHFVSQEEVQIAAPATPLPIHVSHPLLDISGTDSQNLAALLDIRRMSVIELLRTLVFPDIEGAYYQPEDIETVMLYVLRHFYSYIEMDETFIDTLRTLPFLPRKGIFVTPDRLYDPAQQLLKTLFLGEENFPTGQYAEPSIIAILRQVGLRGPADVETEDLLETAYQIQDSVGRGETEQQSAVTKSGALLDYLSWHMDKLYDTTDGQELHHHLAEIQWVPPMKNKPNFYPDNLHWCEGDMVFAKPCEMKSMSYASIAGSVVPVVASGVKEELGQLFGWDKPPTLHQIMRHFVNVVDSYDASEKAKYMELASRLYEQLSQHSEEEIRETRNVVHLDAWVWHGEGFTNLERIIFRDPFMDLRPFVYSIPTEMGQFRQIFETCGVKEECSLPEVLVMVQNKYDKSSERVAEFELKRDLHICVSILNEIKANVTQEQLPELQEILMLPIHNEKKPQTLRLAPLLDSTFCDQEWMRAGYDLRDLLDGEEEEMLFVHPNVPNSTSEALGVPTLMSRMLDAEELDFSFGQTDSLTHRLSVLLQDYTDGFAVPKELVQNADDAGATEVKFLYDERQNMDAQTCLIDESMKECQGPALWVYNDAVFTDDDFENITKLSGATKETQTEKIGRFGLGFNAVYNLTDVPSFISRHNIVIFDPHTTHLGKSIRNKSKPGIKIDMRKHKRKLRRLGNQFKPYNGLFGCDLRPDSLQESFDATLFRFPLRTKSQAVVSEICQKHYDKKEMTTLLQMLISGADRLLLFTQNVTKVTVYHMSATSTDASLPQEVFTVTKTPLKILRQLSFNMPLSVATQRLPKHQQDFIRQTSILKACTETMRKIKEGRMKKDAATPISSLLLQVDCVMTAQGSKLLGLHVSHTANPWMVCSCMGTGESLKMACMEENLLPTAGIAVPLKYDSQNDRYIPQPIMHPSTPERRYGTIFTYLPLPIHTGLPVHINGAFSVTSNRRYLCERNEDDKFDVRAIWNEALMGDAVCDTYLQLLNDLTTISDAALYPFTLLWPNMETMELSSKILGNGFYRLISKVGKAMPSFFSNGTRWVPLRDAVFLSPTLRHSTVGDVTMEVFSNCLVGTEASIIDLPEFALSGFRSAKAEKTILERSYDLQRFLLEILLPNIDSVDAAHRDAIILYALQQNDTEVDKLLIQTNCIPVSPNGETLRSPDELVDPIGDLASLYLPQDGRFPHGSYGSKEMLIVLKRLGMSSDDMSWEDVIERSRSLYELDFLGAKRRVQSLIHFMEKKLEREDAAHTQVYWEQLRNVPFLPIMKRPKTITMPWKGDEYADDQFLSLQEIYPSEKLALVCCIEPIVDETVFPKSNEHVKRFFGFENKTPTLENVLLQFDMIIESDFSTEDREVLDEVQKICNVIYGHLQHLLETVELKDTVTTIIDRLKDQPFIFCNGVFLRPRQVAFDFPHHCAPYIFGLPEIMKRSFGVLFTQVGVRDTFETKDFVETLQTMYATFTMNPLDKVSLKLSIRLVNLLNESLTETHLPLSEVTELYGSIYIPDSNCVLHDAVDLCYNEPECQWLPQDDDMLLSHQLIPYAISKQLGVNTRREEVLRKHSRGIPFGQREKLTNRIKRILSSYPCDKEILKELLQNADDAGATELHFISDSRSHSDERVFNDSWKPLQGPALCVYNNSPFTEMDLQGIQRLGEGSKSADPNKTGQYGVGFNCVYHLTDVPSFLTTSKDIGETLCIFDPHASYVPGATYEEPGRRYEDVQELRDIFTDVFPCYLEDKFDLSHATMFRFPLRTREMANTSELSEQVMTIDKLDNLLVKFMRELFDCLLFVNSVRTISVSQIDPLTNRLTKTYTVNVEISDEDQASRKAFAQFLRDTAERIRNGEIGVWEVPPRELSYVIRLSDNKGYWERWLITQRVGFQDGTKISVALYETLKRGDLALLPRGGVAALLENSDPQTPFRAMKAFCFLPLPLKTTLPVHINGHFALDHEARRNLWIDDENSPKTEWNNTMLKHIIAKAYVSMMRRAPSYISSSALETANTSFFAMEDNEIPNMEFYSSLFPRFKTNETYWRNLAESVYRIIDSSQEPVLPVLKAKNLSNIDLSSDDSLGFQDDMPEIEVEWVSTSGDGRIRPNFDNLDDTFLDKADGTEGIMTPRNRMKSTPKKKTRREQLRRVLLASGYKLLHLPLEVYSSFREAGVLVECVSPSSVIQFYRSYGTVNQACSVGSLPADVSNTPFRNVKTLCTVLEYCVQDWETFFTCLDGLPFMLSEDEQLRIFTGTDPSFLTDYYNLLPECSFMFVHHKVVETIFADVQPEDHHVFQRFDIPAMTSLLVNVLDEHTYRNGGDQIPWKEEEDKLPSAQWIRNLWAFIKSECLRLTKDKDLNEEDMAKQIKIFLKPLRNWCILPAKVPPSKSGRPNPDTLEEPIEMYLVPIGMAETVIDFTQSSIMSYAVRDSLRRLRLPELNSQLLDGTSWSPSPKKKSGQNSLNSSMSESGSNGTSDIVRLLVATLEKPQSVLRVLDYRTRSKPTDGQLKYEDCNYILKYFSEYVGEWLEDPATIASLRNLPFYLTVHGHLISLNNRIVYALPNDIPTADMQVWEKESGILFLRCNKHLIGLHEKLNCLSLSITEVYTRFIFKNFDLLSPDARIVHLQFLKDGRLHQMDKPEKDTLLVGLRHLDFLSDDSGRLHKASHFYDPYHSLFKVMLGDNPGAFPPAPFNEFKWLDFLRLIGMQHEISVNMYVDFAFQISQEALKCPTEKTFNKSRTLLTNLFSRLNLPSEGLLHKISDIKFIPPSKVNSMLQRIYPQYGYRQDGKLEYISFFDSVPETHEYLMWTSGHLIPNWANPYKLTQNDVAYAYPEGHNLKELENYRHEIAKLLGIAAEPQVMKVVQHVQHICNNVYNANASDELRAFMKADVMKMVYKYLQKKEEELGDDVKAALKDCPCVIVELGHNMMRPSQVVINMMEEDQIHPYLYKVPTELGEFKNLFLFLGASLNATVDQFAMVLSHIYFETKGSKLHPNELRAAFKAVAGLFHTLEKHPHDSVHTELLYLPSMSGTLVQARELVFNDDPSYTDRIRDFDRPFIMDLSECGLSALDCDDLIKLLPQRLQPAMLTVIVHEILEKSSRETISSYGIAERLKHQLNSKALSLGISRLVRHEHHRSGQKIQQDTLESIQMCLAQIRVYGVEKVVTFLQYGKRRIAGSEVESECFVDKTEDQGEKLWNVYVDNSATMSEELLVCVAEVVNRIIGGLLRNSVHYLQPILSCPPHAVSKVLDRLKIRPDHSVDIKQPTLPNPGSFIPIDDHHLLKEDFEEYEIGEYVGFELEDNEDSIDALFIYAIIMEKIVEDTPEGEEALFFTQQYKINVGDAHAPAIAQVTDLYKFHRVEGFVSRNTSFMDDSFEGSPTEDQFNSKPFPAQEPRSFSFDSRRMSKEENRYDSNRPGDRNGHENRNGSDRRGSKPSNEHENMNGYSEQSSRNQNGSKSSYSNTRQGNNEQKPPSGSHGYGSQKNESYSRQGSQQGAHNQSNRGDSTFNNSGFEGYSRFFPGSRARSESQSRDQPDGRFTDQGPTQETHIPDPSEDKPEETIMNEISDALEEAWQLTLKERKKVIKRLLLKWHPDKNIGDEVFATTITQFIQSEIDRLEQGLPRPVNIDMSNFTPGNPFAGSSNFQRNFEEAYKKFYDQMNNRGKEHKKQRERYKENFSREYTSTKTEYNFDVPPTFTSTNPQPSAARNFFTQAVQDLKSADNDMLGLRAGPAYEWVCFKAHQAAEKALKAAQYSVDAVSSFTHDLQTLATSTDDVRLRLHAMKLQNLLGDSNKMYNPDPIDYLNIPHNRFTPETAQLSVELANQILMRVQEYMDME